MTMIVLKVIAAILAAPILVYIVFTPLREIRDQFRKKPATSTWFLGVALILVWVIAS